MEQGETILYMKKRKNIRDDGKKEIHKKRPKKYTTGRPGLLFSIQYIYYSYSLSY